MIDSSIVPQLMRNSADADAKKIAAGLSFFPSPQEIAEFAGLCVLKEELAGHKYLERLIEHGHSVAEVMVNLVAPAARWLGEQWDQDQIGFSEVTLGLLRMQNLTHELAAGDRFPKRYATDRFRVLVALAPGSQHILGLTMISELFTSDGWDVRVETTGTEKALLSTLRSSWFDVVGLSVSLAEQLPDLNALISKLRGNCRNPGVGVLLGGAALASAEAGSSTYGSDAVCMDPLAATRIARMLAMRGRGAS
ncbi:cobalamin B12-binding domain-containing protein [Hydrogenophaga sp. T2]|uniref:cobalamin B12-binding domain-containing protein n=1 Tax=Hydrogenophaga sp. T2 TaxID=3132823 RepID=UPI003CE9D1D2